MSMHNDAGNGGDDFSSVNSAADRIATIIQGPEEDDDQDATALDPGAEDDAPAEGQASGEDEGDEPDAPAIDAPASWDAEAKAKFKSLPPDLQELVSVRERERDRVVNVKLQEQAETRRAIEAKAAEASQMRDQYEHRLVQVLRHLDTTIPEEFKAIRSHADLVRLADTNPALVTKFTAWQAQISATANELAQVQQQRSYEQEEARQDYLAREFQHVAVDWPEFSDETKGPVIHGEIRKLGKSVGFSDDEINGLSDHRTLRLVRKAIEGEKAIAALNKARGKVDTKPLPRVMRPGSGEQVGRKGVDRQAATRIARSGDLTSIAATIGKMLS